MSGTFKRFEEIGTLVNFSKTVPLYSPLITQGSLPYELPTFVNDPEIWV